ncbi:hypothetical protein AB0K12_19890 [Nonomuraea sp. NPDC049419]|uniref:hypothetical protein n=1 Tax=Nonomuraea sp. NPDC049419 TaxID=3155772 RepID=UPI00343B7E72
MDRTNLAGFLRWRRAVALSALLLTALPHAGTSLRDVRVLARFDRAAGQAAESIAPEPADTAAINQSSQLVRVNADGTGEVLLDASDGMQGTTAVAVRGNRAYITNGATIVGRDSNLLVADLRRG